MCSYFHTLGMECHPIRGETISLHNLLANTALNSIHFVAVSTDWLLLDDEVSVLDDMKAGGAFETVLVVNSP